MFVGHGNEDWLNPRNLHRTLELVTASQDDAVRFSEQEMCAAEFERDKRHDDGANSAKGESRRSASIGQRRCSLAPTRSNKALPGTRIPSGYLLRGVMIAALLDYVGFRSIPAVRIAVYAGGLCELLTQSGSGAVQFAVMHNSFL
jgi:hypothetical protein